MSFAWLQFVGHLAAMGLVGFGAYRLVQWANQPTTFVGEDEDDADAFVDNLDD